MKRLLLIAMALLMMGSTMMAQPKQGPKPQKMSGEQLSQQVATRMAQRLELDAEKTAKFVPIYMDYRKELKQVWNKYTHPCPPPPKDKHAAKPQCPSEKELEQMATNRFARSRATIDVEETYYKRFLTVLTQQQYEKMLQLEKMHLQRMKDERMRRQQQKKPQCYQCPPPKGKGDAKLRKAPAASDNTVTEISSVEQQSKKSDRWVSMNGTPVDGAPTTSGYYINQGKVVRISQ